MKAQLKKRGLDQKGRKKQLLARLLAATMVSGEETGSKKESDDTQGVDVSAEAAESAGAIETSNAPMPEKATESAKTAKDEHKVKPASKPEPSLNGPQSVLHCQKRPKSLPRLQKTSTKTILCPSLRLRLRRKSLSSALHLVSPRSQGFCMINLWLLQILRFKQGQEKPEKEKAKLLDVDASRKMPKNAKS